MSYEKIKQAIPAEIVMFSGCEDKQTSADVYNVGSFELPNPAGKAGGALTSTLIKVLNEQSGPLTWIDLLHKMRSVLRQKGFDQVPQLSASRMLNVNDQMAIVPRENTGARRALLIGINYVGQKGQLSGCHNDVHNIKDYLIRSQGFPEKDMLILMDDGRHNAPTKQNILNAMQRVTQYSKAGDVVFIHYSGHGGRERDLSGDESDGYDETLIPVDFKRAGQILDDKIYEILVRPMAAGVNCTVLMDCCHSGTVMDLPYTINATESQMHANSGFDLDAILGNQALLCCACLYCLFADDILGLLLGGLFD